MTPTEDLVLEVLAARARTGERQWTFGMEHRPALRRLEAAGLVGWKSGVVERTLLAWLTTAGRTEVLIEDFETPIRRQVLALPEQNATKSRDYGRGYAQAIRDVLELL